MNKSQNDLVLERLRVGPLTPLEALEDAGTFRLAARVHELRLAGYNIESRMIRTEDGKRVAQYSLRRK